MKSKELKLVYRVSIKDEIEVLFHYGGENIWVYVPYDYVNVAAATYASSPFLILFFFMCHLPLSCTEYGSH